MSEVLTIEQLHSILGEEIVNGNGKLPVHQAYNYGDHWNTIVAPSVTTAEVAEVEYSDYHNSYKLIEEGHEPDSEEVHSVLVLD